MRKEKRYVIKTEYLITNKCMFFGKESGVIDDSDKWLFFFSLDNNGFKNKQSAINYYKRNKHNYFQLFENNYECNYLVEYELEFANEYSTPKSLLLKNQIGLMIKG